MRVEIVNFREAMSERGEDYAVAFVEGSITRESDEARLKKIREQASRCSSRWARVHIIGGSTPSKILAPLDDVRKLRLW
jgi:sulfhydrogenase subunit delta